jgi:hypothetical protein
MLNMPLNICIIARSPAGQGIESMSSISPSACGSPIGSSKNGALWHNISHTIITLHYRLIYGLGLHLHK